MRDATAGVREARADLVRAFAERPQGRIGRNACENSSRTGRRIEKAGRGSSFWFGLCTFSKGETT